MWASESEKRDRFIATTNAAAEPDADGVYDMHIERLGVCEDGYQHVIVRHIGDKGVVLHEQRFDHPDAYEDAFQYVDAWIESRNYTLEERFDMQYEREMQERG